jgi:hypothetical protein
VIVPFGILIVLFLIYASQAAGEEPSPSNWHYGGFVDVSYALDFNFPLKTTYGEARAQRGGKRIQSQHGPGLPA